MSSSIYNNLLRFSLFHLSCIIPPSSTTQLETSHYQHGIPGIPTDGKVVLLKNSYNGAQLYLIGTNHVSKQSAETVKKVIDYVNPNVVAVELCKRRAVSTMKWKPEDDTLYNLFRRSMSVPVGLCMKFGLFFQNYQYSLLHAQGIFPGLEFKVAVEESSVVGATCFYIDQDIAVTLQQLSKVSPFYLFREESITRVRDVEVECTRSSVHELNCFVKNLQPEIYEVMVEERDKFMFTNLRSLQGRIVAVVGIGHMDGIELLWKLAEEDDNSYVL